MHNFYYPITPILFFSPQRKGMDVNRGNNILQNSFEICKADDSAPTSCKNLVERENILNFENMQYDEGYEGRLADSIIWRIRNEALIPTNVDGYDNEIFTFFMSFAINYRSWTGIATRLLDFAGDFQPGPGLVFIGSGLLAMVILVAVNFRGCIVCLRFLPDGMKYASSLKGARGAAERGRARAPRPSLTTSDSGQRPIQYPPHI